LKNYDQKIQKPKHIILFIHKEIQPNSIRREASYSLESNWNYQVIENLNDKDKEENDKDLDYYIAKSPTKIFEEISIKDNFGILIKLLRKSIDNLSLNIDQFQVINQCFFEHLDIEPVSDSNQNNKKIIKAKKGNSKCKIFLTC
jgi:hypothetical protein